MIMKFDFLIALKSVIYNTSLNTKIDYCQLEIGFFVVARVVSRHNFLFFLSHLASIENGPKAPFVTWKYE